MATKAGLPRSGPDSWAPHGDLNYVIRQALSSRERLGGEQIDLWQSHRINPKVGRDEHFAAIRALLDDGVIRHAVLSQVTVEEIEAARNVFPVATVQNPYNFSDRSSEDVVDDCECNEIGFIPWYQLAAGRLAVPGGVLDGVGSRHAATSGQIALAWLPKRSPGSCLFGHWASCASGGKCWWGVDSA